MQKFCNVASGKQPLVALRLGFAGALCAVGIRDEVVLAPPGKPKTRFTLTLTSSALKMGAEQVRSVHT